MPAPPLVILTREADDNRELAAALMERGVPVRELPSMATRYVRPATLPTGPFDAAVFSSRRAVRGMVQQGLAAQLLPPEHGTLVAAVGPATARVLTAAGLPVDMVATPPRGKVLAELLAPLLAPGARVLVVRGNLRAGGLDAALTAAGIELVPLQVYENIPPEIPALAPFPTAAVFVASTSAARRVLEKNPWLRQQHFCAIGSTTREALGQLGVSSVELAGTSLSEWTETLQAAHQRAVEREES